MVNGYGPLTRTGRSHVAAPLLGDPPPPARTDPRGDRAAPPAVVRNDRERPGPAPVRGAGQLAQGRARPAVRLRHRAGVRARPAPPRRLANPVRAVQARPVPPRPPPRTRRPACLTRAG